jgi:ribosomal protein L37AE/L43A
VPEETLEKIGFIPCEFCDRCFRVRNVYAGFYVCPACRKEIARDDHETHSSVQLPKDPARVGPENNH